MKQIHLLFLFLFLYLFSHGQQIKVDSLKNKLYNENDVIKKLIILDDLTSALYNINIDDYILYADSMYVLAKQINNKAYIAESLLSKGLYESKKYNNENALKFMEESLKYFTELDSIKRCSDVIGNIGQVYKDIGIIDSAKHYINKSIDISLKINNYSRLFYNYYSLGVHESRLSNNTLAIDYILKAEKNANIVGNDAGVAHANSMLGIIYEEQEFYDKAEEKYIESLKIFQKLGNNYGIAGQTGNLASLYASRDNNYTKSNKFYLKAINNYKVVGAQESISIIQYNLGRNYLNENKLDSARHYLYAAYSLANKINSDYALSGVLSDIAELEFKSKNYKKAEGLLEQSLTDLKDDDFIYEKSKALILASQIYSARNNYKKAYESYVEGKDIEDSLFSLERSYKVLEIETKYQTEKKEKDLAIGKQLIAEKNLEIKTKERTILIFSILILIGIILALFFLYKKEKKKIELKKQVEAFKYGFEQYLVNKYRLEENEIQLWSKISESYSEKEMAEFFFRSIDTIKNWRKSLYAKIKPEKDKPFKQKHAIDLYNNEKNLFKLIKATPKE